jgi:uncharacterized protein
MAVYFASTDFHRMFYPGGSFSLYTALSWAGRSHGTKDLDDFPLAENVTRAARGFPALEAGRRIAGSDIPFFNDWISHRARDAYWLNIDGTKRSAAVKAPVLLIGGWYDPFLPSQLEDFDALRHGAASGAARSRLIIGPWTHAAEVTFPDGTKALNFRRQSLALSLPWFDQNLQPSHARQNDDAPVTIFVMGKNQWRSENEWPLSRARFTPFYLGGAGRANTAAGDGTLSTTLPITDEPSDEYLYDPRNPVPTAGGAMIGGAAGIASQNPVESRTDVLVYTTLPLAGDVEVTGPVKLVLYISTSAPNTDFTAKLADVHPNGSAYNVTDGILRRSYSAPMAGSSTHEIEIELWPTSMVFFKGHRIRLEVSSSNFPRFDLNPNTNTDPATETRPAMAAQIVHHGLSCPSRLILPIIPPDQESAPIPEARSRQGRGE